MFYVVICINLFIQLNVVLGLYILNIHSFYFKWAVPQGFLLLSDNDKLNMLSKYVFKNDANFNGNCRNCRCKYYFVLI